MTLRFPESLPRDDLLTFESQIHNLEEEMLSTNSSRTPSMSMAHGWTVSDVQHEHRQGMKACVVLMRWGSLDHMYNVKRDTTSLFQNVLVPLLNEAENHSTAALYTQLRDSEGERSKCGIM